MPRRRNKSPPPSPAPDPTPFDRRIKYLMELFPVGFVAWLLKVEPIEAHAVDPNIVFTEERRSDKLILATLPGKPPVAVHVDVQTEGRRNMRSGWPGSSSSPRPPRRSGNGGRS